jgi:transposase
VPWLLRAAAARVAEEAAVLTRTQDNDKIIERVAALDIGKAELVCCIRVPDDDHQGKRLQEVGTYSTMTRSLLTPIFHGTDGCR